MNPRAPHCQRALGAGFLVVRLGTGALRRLAGTEVPSSVSAETKPASKLARGQPEASA
jgi:hypothetical protein